MFSPKFSILLPTRNRLDLAKTAIETVRRQTYQNWELVVSDNCSQDDVLGYIRNLNDERIVYIRSNEPLAVTENWNRALDASNGDYVVMLGDDDGLTPGYFEKVISIAESLQPELIYHGAYQFTYPGVLQHSPGSSLKDVSLYSITLQGAKEPKILPTEIAREAGRKSLDFWAAFGFNMQHFVFTRGFIRRMAEFGSFFQGPFPDFSAGNMALLTADRIAVFSEPLVIIGISAKSYGHYHYNSKERGGIDLLQAGNDIAESASAEVKRVLLPGTNMLNSWLITVSRIPEKFPGRNDLKLGIHRYRRLQILHNIQNRALTGNSEASLSELWSKLSWRERLFGIYLKLWMVPLPILPAAKKEKWAILPRRRYRQFLKLKPRPPAAINGKYRTLLDVFLDLEAQSDT